MDEARSAPVRPRKKLLEKGTSDKQIDKQADKQTNRHTLRLLDQLGPEGRVGEKGLPNSPRCFPYSNKVE